MGLVWHWMSCMVANEYTTRWDMGCCVYVFMCLVCEGWFLVIEVDDVVSERGHPRVTSVISHLKTERKIISFIFTWRRSRRIKKRRSTWSFFPGHLRVVVVVVVENAWRLGWAYRCARFGELKQRVCRVVGHAIDWFSGICRFGRAIDPLREALSINMEGTWNILVKRCILMGLQVLLKYTTD